MDELDQIKQLAGIKKFQGLQEYSINDGSNISLTGTAKRQLEKKHNIQPGTDAWFKLWFSLPYLTGEKPV
jgi:hypothetical protein